jgi:SM-20-related protein
MELNLPAFHTAPLVTKPFPYAVVPSFLSGSALAEIGRDFPKIDMAGLFPPEELRYGPGFARLLDLLQGEPLRKAVEEKFGVDLVGRPIMTTVRACARPRDGRIHRDSKFKLVTLVLYLNEQWYPDGGRLRVLRSPDDIEDYATEVPPEGGLLFAFRCTDNAWHGHKPIAGARRYIMMNYVADEEVRQRELARHRFSAKVKKAKRLLGWGKVAA